MQLWPIDLQASPAARLSNADPTNWKVTGMLADQPSPEHGEEPPEADGFIMTPPEHIKIRPRPVIRHHNRDQRVTDTFRSMAPYIANHRGSIMVVHVPGEAIGSQCDNFVMLMQVLQFGRRDR
jgi:hypothetical protein